MGIRFACPECNESLNIKQELAGRRSKCPRCGSRFRIPLKDQPFADRISLQPAVADTGAVTLASSQSALSDVATESMSPPVPVEDPLLELPGASWYVRPQSGGQYGPATADIMRQWLKENRVGASALVWREGWAMWRNAAEIFPQLATATTTASPPATGISRQPQNQTEPGYSVREERDLFVDRKRKLAKRRAMTLAILAGISVLLLAVFLGIVLFR